MRTTPFPRTIAALGLLLAPVLAVPPAEGAVKVPALVGSHMVLQADEPARVWGWALPGEKVLVTVAGAHAEATADGDGRWATDLPPRPAGGPHVLTVSGEETLTFEDVWFGEVWVGSGQSNMQWPLTRSTGGEEAAGAGCDGLRLFTVTHATSLTPREDVGGQWVPCTAETAPSFSAVAFHFGQKLHAELGVKIGLIHSSWGGTPAEAWTSREALEAEPSLRSMVAGFDAALNDPEARKAFAAQLEAWEETNYHQDTGNQGFGKGWARPDFGSQPRYPSPDDPNSPTVLYGAMVAPLTPYTIRGAIWYQGEANAGAAWQYRTLFPAMIRDWRRSWGRGDFPFLFVQLANFMARSPEPGESTWAELREAQALTLGLPNTGMAVIIDIGEADDIHPRNKVDVGHRLARWALADTYGRDVVESGPLYASSVVEGAAVRVRFHHANGLTSSDGEAPRAFAVAGEDRHWRWADARIDGETLLVSSPDVPQPVAVRYAWADNPEATLTNGAGLPASPFRTDDWPALTAPKEMADGRALVRAMHARYADRWYRDFMLVQDVTYYEDGRETGQERMAEYISLPGRVRAIIGDIEEGDADIYVDGAFHRFEDGQAVGRLPTVHAVLVTGFDVYAQDPERTIAQLEELGIDLERVSESAWDGRPAWVVGAAPGDGETPQMWVEKDRLLCVRVLSQRPYGVLDVEMGGYEPLGEGWIATELVFKRNGDLALREDYAEFRTLEGIDPALFDVDNLKTEGALP
jgi:sialate O-acetylesterase